MQVLGSRKTYTSYHSLRQPPHQTRQGKVQLLNVFISPTLSFLRHLVTVGSPKLFVITAIHHGQWLFIIWVKLMTKTPMIVHCVRRSFPQIMH